LALNSAPNPPIRVGGAWVPGTLVVVTFVALLWSVRDAWSPLLLLALLLASLIPFRGAAWVLVAATGASVLTLLWIIQATGFLLAPFVVSLGIAYVLDPLADRLSRRVPRAVAIVLLGLPVAGALVLLVVFGVPALWREAGDLIGRLPALVERAAGWFETLPDRLRLVRIPGIDGGALAERLRSVDAEAVMEFLDERREAIGQQVWGGVLGLGRGVATFVTLAGYVVLTPVLTFYLLRDWDRLVERTVDLVPAGVRPGVVRFGHQFDRLIAGYLRGQLTVALIVGSITALGLWVLGIPYAFLLGALAAVFGVIPYLGLVLSLVPAVGIAFLTPDPGVGLLKVLGVYAFANLLEGSVISPRIVGDSTGLHPVLVVLALALGGFFLGFVGLLLAVPAAAGIRLLAALGVERYRSSALYTGRTTALPDAAPPEP
jgi:predicted PurR-regulated permease PerM